MLTILNEYFSLLTEKEIKFRPPQFLWRTNFRSANLWETDPTVPGSIQMLPTSGKRWNMLVAPGVGLEPARPRRATGLLARNRPPHISAFSFAFTRSSFPADYSDSSCVAKVFQVPLNS